MRFARSSSLQGTLYFARSLENGCGVRQMFHKPQHAQRPNLGRIRSWQPALRPSRHALSLSSKWHMSIGRECRIPSAAGESNGSTRSQEPNRNHYDECFGHEKRLQSEFIPVFTFDNRIASGIVKYCRFSCNLFKARRYQAVIAR